MSSWVSNCIVAVFPGDNGSIVRTSGNYYDISGYFSLPGNFAHLATISCYSTQDLTRVVLPAFFSALGRCRYMDHSDDTINGTLFIEASDTPLLLTCDVENRAPVITIVGVVTKQDNLSYTVKYEGFFSSKEKNVTFELDCLLAERKYQKNSPPDLVGQTIVTFGTLADPRFVNISLYILLLLNFFCSFFFLFFFRY